MPLSSAVWALSSERSSRVSSPILSSSTTIRYGTSRTYGGCVSYSRRAASSLTVVRGNRSAEGSLALHERGVAWPAAQYADTLSTSSWQFQPDPSSRTHTQGVFRTEVVSELLEGVGSPSWTHIELFA